jgi:TRAP-type C4-dicarboxylate transport system permease small subunit
MRSDNGYIRAVDLIDRLFLWIAGAALLLMMVHISVDVVANLVLKSPVPLTNASVTQYYMIAVAYLPLAAAEYRGAHISVDLVVNWLPRGLRRVLDHIVQFLAMVAYAALGLQAWQLALEKLGRNAFLMEQTTRVTTWPSYFIIPAGFWLVALLLAVRLACRMLGRAEPTHAPIPVEEQGHV